MITSESRNMKKYILWITGILLISSVRGQSDYLEYARNMRLVGKHFSHEKYVEAYTLFKESTVEIGYIKAEDLRTFSAICLNTGNCEEGLKAYKQAVKQGFDFKTDYLKFF